MYATNMLLIPGQTVLFLCVILETVLSDASGIESWALPVRRVFISVLILLLLY